MSQFTTCPACNHTRQPADHAPNWQCPNCRMAYVKAARISRNDGTKDVRPIPLSLPMEQEPQPDLKKKKPRNLANGLVITATAGALLFIIVQAIWEKIDALPPGPPKPVHFKTMLKNANGCFAFTAQKSRDQWKVDSEKWLQKSVVTAQHTAGTSGLGVLAFAQSFVPHTDVIKAIHVGLYPVGGPQGWIRFQITEDARVRPGEVLATAWMRIDDRCPVQHGGYMIVPFGDVAVKPDGFYWFTVVEFREPAASKNHLTNLGISANTDIYTEGTILLPPKHALRGLFDANFRIVADYKDLPGIRAASDDEKRSLPSQEEQEAVRNIWTEEVPQPAEAQK